MRRRTNLGCDGSSGLLALVLLVVGCTQAIAGPEAEDASAAGDTAVQLRRPAEAILQYQRARELGFRDTASLDARVAGAEVQRQAFLRMCENGTGEPARRACLVARLPGAPDEARVKSRIDLLEGLAHRIEAPRRMQANSSTLESDSFPSATEARYSNAAAPTQSH